MAMKRMVSFLLSLLFVCLTGCGLQDRLNPSPCPSLSPTAEQHTSVISTHLLSPAPTASPSPSPSQSPTVEPATPTLEPEETAYVDPYKDLYTKAGLSRVEFDHIYNLVDSSVYMGFFSDINDLKEKDLTNFIFDFFNGNPQDWYGDKWDFNPDSDSMITVDPMTAQTIIDSAFGSHVRLKNKNVGNKLDDISYRNGFYHILVGDLYYCNCPVIYRIDCISEGKYTVYMNLVFPMGDGSTYCGKSIATVQKAKDSIFGFHILSLVRNNTPTPKVVSVAASSCLKKSGTKTYIPQNVIDNKNKTAWATNNGANEWIQLNFATSQTITGMVLRLGDWTNEALLDKSGMPCHVTVEFSDGYSENLELRYSYMDYPNPYEIFSREITTNYIRIVVHDVQYGDGTEDGSGPIYISEISPF